MGAFWGVPILGAIIFRGVLITKMCLFLKTCVKTKNNFPILPSSFQKFKFRPIGWACADVRMLCANALEVFKVCNEGKTNHSQERRSKIYE